MSITANKFYPVFFLFCIVFHSPLVAQTPAPRPCEIKAKSETRWMQQNLVLNARQYQQVQQINLHYCCAADSLSALRNKTAA